MGKPITDLVSRSVEYNSEDTVDETREDGTSEITGGSPNRTTKTKDTIFADTRGNRLTQHYVDTYNTNIAGEHSWNEEETTSNEVSCRNGATVRNPDKVFEQVNGQFSYLAQWGIGDWLHIPHSHEFKAPNPIAAACNAAAVPVKGKH